jgi:hypothetical protein
MRAYMWDKMKDLLFHGAIETNEKMAADSYRRTGITAFPLTVSSTREVRWGAATRRNSLDARPNR